MEHRSPLGRVRGLGSSKTGSHHWLVQRFTAVALIPLSLWMIFSMVHMAGADYATFQSWIGEHGHLVGTIAFSLAIFYHAQLGLQVVIEDYVHTEIRKLILLIIMKLVTFAGAASCIVAALQVAFIG